MNKKKDGKKIGLIVAGAVAVLGIIGYATDPDQDQIESANNYVTSDIPVFAITTTIPTIHTTDLTTTIKPTTTQTTTMTRKIVTTKSVVTTVTTQPTVKTYHYILNNSTHVYHVSASCRAAERISEENRSEFDGIMNDSRISGYDPCGICAK